MRRLYWIAGAFVMGACSFPTGEFTLGRPTTDVPAVIDAPVADVSAADAPAADAPAADASVDTPPIDDAPVDMPAVDMPAVDTAPIVDAPADAPPPDMAPVDVPPACGPGEALCEGRCTNVISNSANCGMCGRACDTGRACQLGGCQVANTLRYHRVAVTDVEAPFVNACAGGMRVLASMDDASVLIPLPFTFSLFGAPVAASTMVNLSTNGFLSLEPVMNTSNQGSIPNMAAPNSVIAPYWTDLIARMGGICYLAEPAEGAFPRRFVIEWQGTAFVSTGMGAGDLTFEIVLSEGTNTIDFIYQYLSDTPRLDGRTLTIGVESAAGTDAFAVCNESLLNCGIATGSRVRLVP